MPDWERFGLIDAVCDHCGQPLHRDSQGWWVGGDGTPECGASTRGHEIEGRPR